MDILLTGGTGFIGSYVALELLKYGHHVTILARNRNKIPELHTFPQIKIVEGTLGDFALLEELITGKDACILTALNYTRQSARDVLEDDTLPTVYMSDIAAKSGVKHFIYTSSTSVHDSLYSGEPGPQGVPVHLVTDHLKAHPATFYGATKAASENFLIAQSFLSAMRVNIIRPGYTFGNPAITGGPTQGDTQFRDIVRSALQNAPIELEKHGGTQFIWAGDLAKLYVNVLHSDVNRKIYFGLSKDFISWQSIAQEAVRRCGSKSDIVLKESSLTDEALCWDVSSIKNDFGHEFDAWEKLIGHLEFYIAREDA